MSNLIVSNTFLAVDRVSGVCNKMTVAVNKFGKTADSAFKRASTSGRHFEGVARGVLTALVIRRGAAYLQQGVSGLVQEFANFDDAIMSAAAKQKGFNFQLKDGKALFNQLKEAALSNARATKFTATDSATALDKLALSGYKAASAIAVLPGASNLATIAQTDLTEATGMMTGMLGALGLRTEDNNKLMENTVWLNDQLAAVVTNVNANLNDVFETVIAGGPQFVGAGEQAISTFLTLAGVLADAGIIGEKAGTGIRNMMIRVGGPTASAIKSMQALGVTAATDGRNFDDFLDVVDRFKDSLVGLGSQEKVSVLSSIFGVRAATISAALIDRNSDAVRKLQKEIVESKGAMDSMAGSINLSVGNQWLLVISNLYSVGIETFYKFEKQIRSALANLITYLSAVKAENVAVWARAAIEVFKDFGAMFRVLYEIAKPFFPMVRWGLRTLANNIENLKPYLQILTAAWAVTKITIFIEKIYLLSKAFLGLEASVWAVNIAMDANPIGLVIAGVAALILGAVWLYRNWEKVRASFAKWRVQLANLPPWLRTIVAPVEYLVVLADTLLNHWRDLKAEIFAIYDKIKGIVTSSTFQGMGLAMQGGAGLYYTSPYQAPNQAAVDRQDVSFKGVLDINGAPDGATFSAHTSGAPAIRTNLTGKNQ